MVYFNNLTNLTIDKGPELRKTDRVQIPVGSFPLANIKDF